MTTDLDKDIHEIDIILKPTLEETPNNSIWAMKPNTEHWKQEATLSQR